MSLNYRPTEQQIRAAIEARIDRLMALEQLAWELSSFVEDVWGPVPGAWSERVVELGATLGQPEASVMAQTGQDGWEARRARVLAEFGPEDRWRIGLRDRLLEHAFGDGREAIRQAAAESFLSATLAFVDEHPDAPPVVRASELGADDADDQVKRSQAR